MLSLVYVYMDFMGSFNLGPTLRPVLIPVIFLGIPAFGVPISVPLYGGSLDTCCGASRTTCYYSHGPIFLTRSSIRYGKNMEIYRPVYYPMAKYCAYAMLVTPTASLTLGEALHVLDRTKAPKAFGALGAKA